MIDDSNRDDADRQAAELAMLIHELTPSLTDFLRSRIGHRGARCLHDVEEILQMTIVQVLIAARNSANPIRNPRPFIFEVAKNCHSQYVRQNSRQPKSIDDFDPFVDPYIRLPDQVAQDREVYERVAPALRRLDEWHPPFLNSLITIGGQLHDFDSIRDSLAPWFDSGRRASKHGPGRPNKIEEVGNALLELRPRIALLTEFFQEF